MIRVLQSDGVLERRGNQNIAVEFQQFSVGDAVATGESQQAAGLLLIVQRRRQVDALAVIHAAFGIAGGDNGGAVLPEQPRRNASSVPEPLYRHPGFRQSHASQFASPARGKLYASRGGFVTSLRAAQAEGFARNHAQLGVAVEHADGVHDPRHGLRRGIHVGSRNVAVRPDDRCDFGRIAAREAFEFSQREPLRIDAHTALAPAVRNIHRRAFPRHPRGQRLYFIQRYIGMVTDAAFCRPACEIVLHAVSLIYLDFAVIHAHRYGDDQLALGSFQDRSHSFIELEVIRGSVELCLRDLKRIQSFFGQHCSNHVFLLF